VVLDPIIVRESDTLPGGLDERLGGARSGGSCKLPIEPVGVVLSLLQSPLLGLTADQITAGRIAAAEILRSLPGTAQALPMPMPQ